MRDEQMEIQEQIAQLQDKAKNLAERKKAMGEDNWAVEKFHEMTCHCEFHGSCGYSYDNADAFDKKGTAKNREKLVYLKIKQDIEKVVKKELTHKEALKIIDVVEQR